MHVGLWNKSTEILCNDHSIQDIKPESFQGSEYRSIFNLHTDRTFL